MSFIYVIAQVGIATMLIQKSNFLTSQFEKHSEKLKTALKKEQQMLICAKAGQISKNLFEAKNFLKITYPKLQIRTDQVEKKIQNILKKCLETAGFKFEKGEKKSWPNWRIIWVYENA